jgi:tRNA pseudouridine55 synthase
VVEERAVTGVDRAAIEAACARFTGRIEQRPPMFSALKHQGKALYEYARAGVEIERPTRSVDVHHIHIIEWHAETLVIDVACSKGTYIRTLAEDLGERLGCGAHLTALRRTASGPVTVDDAITIDALNALEPAEREARLLPPDVLLGAWPALRLAAEEAGRFLSGLRRRVAERDCAAVRVYGPEPRAFLGSAHVKAGELIPGRLLSPPEVQALIALSGAAATNESKQASTP